MVFVRVYFQIPWWHIPTKTKLEYPPPLIWNIPLILYAFMNSGVHWLCLYFLAGGGQSSSSPFKLVTNISSGWNKNNAVPTFVSTLWLTDLLETKFIQYNICQHFDSLTSYSQAWLTKAPHFQAPFDKAMWMIKSVATPRNQDAATVSNYQMTKASKLVYL